MTETRAIFISGRSDAAHSWDGGPRTQTNLAQTPSCLDLEDCLLGVYGRRDSYQGRAGLLAQTLASEPVSITKNHKPRLRGGFLELALST